MKRSDDTHKSKPSGRRKTRTGIPVFERGEDIAALFRENEERHPRHLQDPGPENQNQDRRDLEKEAGRLQARDKHGLPVLDGRKTLVEIFDPKPEKDSPESFAELVDETLKGKSMDALLRAKRERGMPDPVPVHKRIKRYPPPEKELDLHGFTAAGAQVRAASFLRSSLRNGIFTVRIIVGRGLHSEMGAILPDVVEDILIAQKKDGVVLWFQWEKRKKSRSGSVIVYMNQFND